MSRFILGLLAISSLDEISISEGQPGQPEGGTLRFATIAESLGADLFEAGHVDANQDEREEESVGEHEECRVVTHAQSTTVSGSGAHTDDPHNH